ncbi:MAG: pectate lyase [Petrimonas sp.]|nr:pectate lyase [Petrimonas sp.]
MRFLNLVFCVLVTVFIITSCQKSIPNLIEKIPDEETPHVYPTPVSEKAYAFPGAYGGGAGTTGGRGGKVFKITSLEDTNTPGTFRYAANQTGARIIIFDVSGTIHLQSKLSIKNGDITIAGQTAQGDGVCFADYPVEISADNVVVRYVRFRMGDKQTATIGADGADSFSGRGRKNIMIDHCSVSWSTDECSSFYDNENFTMQWCIISESLRLSAHSKGAHGYGGIWGGVNTSFHHNLLAHHDSRNPRFCGSRYSNHPEMEKIDFRNNVIYNWGSNNVYGAEGGSYNIVNNYYKPGPASSNTSRIIQPYADDGSNNQPEGTYGRFYVNGNFVYGRSSVTSNNLSGVNLHSSFSLYAPAVTLNEVISSTAFELPEIPMQTATQAFEKVLLYAGCSFSRDGIDNRIVNETKTGTTEFIGSDTSLPGIIDSQDDLKPITAGSDWSAWPILKNGTTQKDSDGDGMHDDWETANKLDPNTYDANGRHLSTGYDNIEIYLNSLVKNTTEEQYK